MCKFKNYIQESHEYLSSSNMVANASLGIPIGRNKHKVNMHNSRSKGLTISQTNAAMLSGDNLLARNLRKLVFVR
jgi:hypothetical protein